MVETSATAALASPSWTHRPEDGLIGVSVFKNQNRFSLRFHIRYTHLDRLHKPTTLGIRGSAQNGFILTPDSQSGVKPFRVAKTDLFYLVQTVTKFDLSKQERRTVWMRPEFENGHLRVPPLPPAWIAVESEFMLGESPNEAGARTMSVSRMASMSRGLGVVKVGQYLLPFRPPSHPRRRPINYRRIPTSPACKPNWHRN